MSEEDETKDRSGVVGSILVVLAFSFLLAFGIWILFDLAKTGELRIDTSVTILVLLLVVVTAFFLQSKVLKIPGFLEIQKDIKEVKSTQEEVKQTQSRIFQQLNQLSISLSQRQETTVPITINNLLPASSRERLRRLEDLVTQAELAEPTAPPGVLSHEDVIDLHSHIGILAERTIAHYLDFRQLEQGNATLGVKVGSLYMDGFYPLPDNDLFFELKLNPVATLKAEEQLRLTLREVERFTLGSGKGARLVLLIVILGEETPQQRSQVQKLRVRLQDEIIRGRLEIPDEVMFRDLLSD